MINKKPPLPDRRFQPPKREPDESESTFVELPGITSKGKPLEINAMPGYVTIEVDESLKAIAKVFASIVRNNVKAGYEMGYKNKGSESPLSIIAYNIMHETPFWGGKAKQVSAYLKATRGEKSREAEFLLAGRGVVIGNYDEVKIAGFTDKNIIIDVKKGNIRKIYEVSEKGVSRTIDAPPRF